MKRLNKLVSKEVKNLRAVKGGSTNGIIDVSCDHAAYHDGKCVSSLKLPRP